MNKLSKRVVAFLGALTIFATSSVSFAAEFIDMPDNWTTQALLNAVENGLLYGSPEGDKMKINPDGNITRVEAAAIIVRAFGATKTADISKYTDIKEGAWYYKELEKAVYMNAFRGDGNKMNPQNNITFQECFTVVSQLLRLDTAKVDDKCLEKFIDKHEVSAWALPYVKAVVGGGLWDGIDSKLLPTQYITRSQFAVLMNNMADTYIDTPGEYSEEYTGNIMVRCDGVTFKNAKIKGDILVGDGVSKGVVFDGVTVEDHFYFRGGSENMLKNNTTAKRCVLTSPGTRIILDETIKFQEQGYTDDKTYVALPWQGEMAPSK